MVVRVEAALDDLDGDLLLELAVVAHGGEDRAHAAAPHLARDAVAPDTPAVEARAFGERVGAKRRRRRASCRGRPRASARPRAAAAASGQAESRKAPCSDGASSTAASKIRLISCQISG